MSDFYLEALSREARDIRRDLEQREVVRAEEEAEFVEAETKRRYADWLDGMRQRFADEARADYRAEHPPKTFEQVAEFRIRAEEKRNGNSVNEEGLRHKIEQLVVVDEENLRNA